MTPHRSHIPFYLCAAKNNTCMNWVFLFIAGILEIGFSISLAKMKGTAGLLFAGWTAAFLFFLFASLWLMYKAIETIPVGTAYAVWTGIGSVGTVIVGILFFKEPSDFWRLFFICTLIISVIGLKLVSD
jgi:quaternary ammonium compound-resistance protein SugE